jgi:hypothetical protein
MNGTLFEDTVGVDVSAFDVHAPKDEDVDLLYSANLPLGKSRHMAKHWTEKLSRKKPISG